VGKIVCVSNCMHQRDGECTLDFNAITRDMTSVQCFRVREAVGKAADGRVGNEEEKDDEPPALRDGPVNPFLLCRNR
jgi:hypothetical protein